MNIEFFEVLRPLSELESTQWDNNFNQQLMDDGLRVIQYGENCRKGIYVWGGIILKGRLRIATYRKLQRKHVWVVDLQLVLQHLKFYGSIVKYGHGEREATKLVLKRDDEPLFSETGLKSMDLDIGVRLDALISALWLDNLYWHEALKTEINNESSTNRIPTSDNTENQDTKETRQAENNTPPNEVSEIPF